MAQFFIDRPIFAWVIAIIIMLAGLLSVFTLPVGQFPPLLAPPTITLSVNYNGASAQTLQDSVTQVIEQKMNGLDKLLYMKSGSSAEGAMRLRLTFDPSVDVDTAQMQVQNRLQLAMNSLPEQVKRQGIVVRKVSDSFLQRYAFLSSDSSIPVEDIADFVSSTLLDPLTRIEGVGDATLYAAPYAMRIWLNPQKLLAFSMTPSDVVHAIEAQNDQISVGQLGGQPLVEGQEINVTLLSREKMQSIEEFSQIVLRGNAQGAAVRVRDVARVEMGLQSYTHSSRFNGSPAVAVGIQLAEGANAVETSERVAAFMEKMQPLFPDGLEYVLPDDTVPFVKLSIKSVFRTLVEAIILVSLIIFLFLQNFRATLIPSLAVPVVLLGTFAIMAALGLTINTLTMFGLVLVIGLLVDDAIVVVENTERLMHDEGLSPYEATCKSMQQVTGALIGVAAVLSAVFIPMAFFGGMTGAIYRQFSLTIIAAMGLSVLVAIVFTPPLCATLLRNRSTTTVHQGLFGRINRVIDSATQGYTHIVTGWVQRYGRYMLLYVLLVAAVGLAFRHMPTSFLPVEDQGSIIVNVFLPPGATREATIAVAEKVEKYFLEEEKEVVEGFLLTLGVGGNGSKGQNAAQGFVRLKDWTQRTGKGQDSASIAKRARARLGNDVHARILFSLPPQVSGLGNASGISLELQDQGGLGHEDFLAARDSLIQRGNQSPLLFNVRSSALEDIPQLRVVLDDLKMSSFGLDAASVNEDLSTAWGGNYVNDFIDRGRVKRVYVQGDAPYRMNPQDLKHWYFRNAQGDMVPLHGFATTRWTYAPAQLDRYNGVPSFLLEASPAEGVSSGVAMQELVRLIGELPEGISYEWTGLSYQEHLSGSKTMYLYALSILVVFLSLAALYESWSIPFAVVLIVPIGMLGALGLSMARGLSNDIYFQVGLLAVIGLAAKNAILIVEFARKLHIQGASVHDAVIEAARVRLRPIVMTSCAFLLGVAPLTLSNGAGAKSQHAIGTGVMGGTFLATALGVFFVPVFFVAVWKVFSWRSAKSKQPSDKVGG